MARKKSWPRSRTRAPRGAGDTRVLPEKTASSERKEVVGFGMTAEEITWYDVEGLKASLRDL